uniref:RRM domain-containing protein n=1 Tax=Entomoneis paludosa TaxID=265537 RepID=A0A7S2V751_9STRA|eukprot:CAMPEP_0172439364 /NCGR_PEP_ID=MMETSP1065-20121228/376_1 /TAXON_ID=265537 /ORGANISM="Amphiprora paludosa, Strain CCMP125" /LENGTH=276 /DNA_ID=CAMNT_0013188039 /DNA_START=28 /DNA_END=858 /DNA_ORIENTATION=-
MADSLMVEEAALQAQLECVEENEEVEDKESGMEDADGGEKTNESKKKMKKRLRKGARSKNGVLYIGHLGNDFQEAELAKFLSQFGKVRALRLSRSKRTGNPKGYAFCQMETPEIADIVADTLSGYILFGKRRLVCKVVPPEKVHDKLFYRFVYKPPEPRPQKKSLSKIKAVTKKLVEREKRKRKVLEDLGIDYDFPGFEASVTPEKEEVKEKSSKPKKKARKVSDVDVAAKNEKEDEELESPEKTKEPVTETASSSKKSKKSKDAKKSKKKKRRTL